MSRDLFSDKNNGYKLKTLQLLNWGVFNESVATFEFNNASTILTGLNGSGKTTTVDAILTLLVPANLRYYNLSSDSIRKRERDVENYILGSYGSYLEQDGSGSAKCLRKKDEVLSLLDGIFFDENKESYVTLLQVRYFSSGDIKTTYIISDKELRLEELKSIDIRPGARWTKDVEALGAYVTDSSNAYTEKLISKFGLKSRIALKLFSQTVGMKVLGDVTSFIRQYMLEDKSPLKEYDNLKSNFSELKSIDNEIKKTEIEVRELEKVLRSGDEYTQAEAEFIKADNNEKAEKHWFTIHAKATAESEIREKSIDIEALKDRQEINKAKREEISARRYALENNEDAKVIDKLKTSIELKRKDEAIVSDRYTSYSASYEKLKALGAALKAIDTEESFIDNLKSIPALLSNVKANKEKAEEEKQELEQYIRDDREEKEKAEKELLYLSNKNTNIPEEYDAIREDLALYLDISPSELPYAGELIALKDGEERWERAIENALEPLSLALIVKPEHIERAEEYLETSNANRLIRVIKAEATISDLDISDETMLRGKLNIRDCAYKSFIKEYIDRNLGYKCVEKLDEYRKEEKSIHISGLFKDRERETKDDRIDSKSFPRYLGWNNEKKKEELRERIYALDEELEDLNKKKKSKEERIRGAELSIRELEKLEGFRSWQDVDIKTIRNELSALQDKLEMLLKDNEKLKRIEEEKRDLKEQRLILDKELDTLAGNVRELELSIESISRRLAEIKSEDEDIDQSIAEAFVKSYKAAIAYSSFMDLLSKHNRLREELHEKKELSKSTYEKKRDRLERAMHDFMEPSKDIIAPESSWRDEVREEFEDKAEYLDDFRSLYTTLVDENLVENKEKFNEYFKNDISNVIGVLSESLNRWDKEIESDIRTLNRNLRKIPFSKERNTYIELEKLPSGDKDYTSFNKDLTKAIPDKLQLIASSEEEKAKLFQAINAFLNKYSDDKLRRSVLDLRGKYKFIIKENNIEGESINVYKDTAALSGGEKAKLTYTILAAALAYQYNLDSEEGNGPFRFVILDEAFSKSDAINSEYALELFKELDLQLMVITPRNGINLVEGYVSSLHLIEKRDDNTSHVQSMTIEEYREAE